MWSITDIGAALLGRLADALYCLAGGAADGVEQEGEIIDLQAIGNPRSCKIVVGWKATCTDTETFTHGFDVDHGDESDLSDAAQFSEGVAAAVLFTADDPTLSDSGQYELDLDLSGAKRYIRVQHTATMSAGATDIAEIGINWVFGGFANLPATESA